MLQSKSKKKKKEKKKKVREFLPPTCQEMSSNILKQEKLNKIHVQHILQFHYIQ